LLRLARWQERRIIPRHDDREGKQYGPAYGLFIFAEYRAERETMLQFGAIAGVVNKGRLRRRWSFAGGFHGPGS
jgi:hypothetical protein